jgi:hypothetical protein
VSPFAADLARLYKGGKMIPGNYDLKLYQGATINVLVEWLDGATALPIDLTGWSAVATFRETVDDVNSLFVLSSEDGTISLGGELGTIHLLAPSPPASTFEVTKGEWDLLATNPDGQTDAILRGTVRFVRSITR